MFLSCKRVPDSRNAGTGVKPEPHAADRGETGYEEEEADGMSALEGNDDGEQPCQRRRQHEIESQRPQDEPHIP